MRLERRPNIIIGIDPAFRSEGFAIAIIDLTDRSLETKIFENGFIDFFWWFLHDSPDNAVVGVENSNKQNSTFYTHRDKKTFKLLTRIQAQFNRNAVILTPEEAAKLSRDVGKNQATSQNTVDICKSKYKVLDLSPLEKGSKWNNKQFQGAVRLEKLKFRKKRSNQDERDASKVAIITMKRWYEAK